MKQTDLDSLERFGKVKTVEELKETRQMDARKRRRAYVTKKRIPRKKKGAE